MLTKCPRIESNCLLCAVYMDKHVCGSTRMQKYKDKKGILWVMNISDKVNCPAQMSAEERRRGRKRIYTEEW